MKPVVLGQSDPLFEFLSQNRKKYQKKNPCGIGYVLAKAPHPREGKETSENLNLVILGQSVVPNETKK